MNKSVFTAVFYSFAFLLILYFITSVFAGTFFSDELSSETLDEISYDKYITIEGIALRNETILFSPEQYYSIRYLVENGDRVSIESSFAAYLTVQPDEANRERLMLLYRKINQLEETVNKTTQYDVVTLDKKIKSEILEYLAQYRDAAFTEQVGKADGIQVVMNQREIATSGNTYYEITLGEYTTEQKSVIAESSASEKKLYTGMAGYFTSVYDGYEYLKVKDYTDITVADYKKLIENTAENIPALYVGKIQNEPVWKFYSLINTGDATELYVGKSVPLEFETEKNKKCKVNTSIEYISKPVDGQVAVTFTCNTLNADLFTIRKCSCRMILKTYNGFRVSSDALRVSNGETGVYVLSGQRVIFKPVTVLCSTESFSVVSSKNTTGSRVLMAKDEVVIGGRDLFDGKILNLS